MRNSVPIRPDFRPSCGSTVAIKVTRCTADSKNQIRVSQIVSAPTCVVPARNNFNLNFVMSFTTCVLASRFRRRGSPDQSEADLASQRRAPGKAVDIAARKRLRLGMTVWRQLIAGSLAASVPQPTGHLTVMHRDRRGPCVR
jgi:hypothetical protein